jgi:hypothetical protein
MAHSGDNGIKATGISVSSGLRFCCDYAFAAKVMIITDVDNISG